MLFPVQRPGEDITAEWEFVSSFWQFYFFPKKHFQYFPTKKKKKRKKKDMTAAPLATISATAGQETNFFLRLAPSKDYVKLVYGHILA